MNKLFKNKIKIDIVADVVCPWCIIGYKRLARAITEMNIQDQVEIEWQPFELNPDMPGEGENMQVYLARAYGSSLEEIKESQANITRLGEELGFKFDYFDEIKIVNTRNAHIALEFAQEFGKKTELKLALYKAFFSNRKDISDPKVIMQILKEIGLNPDELPARLGNSAFHEKVQANEAHWIELGIDLVPTFYFNQQKVLIGDQPITAYKKVLAEFTGYSAGPVDLRRTT